MHGFRFRSILYSERCAKKLSSALSKFKYLAAKHSCLNPLWTYFPVTCPRMDPNHGITARGWACMSAEETVVVLGCWLFIYWCSEDLNEEFSLSRNRFSGELPQARTTILLFSSYSGQIFPVEIFCLVDESNFEFARHNACYAWSAVTLFTRQV